MPVKDKKVDKSNTNKVLTVDEKNDVVPIKKILKKEVDKGVEQVKEQTIEDAKKALGVESKPENVEKVTDVTLVTNMQNLGILPSELVGEPIKIETLVIPTDEPLIPQSSSQNSASRHVVTASSVTTKVVNKPRLYNPKGVPSTVKSIVDSERTGIFRINRDKEINN